MTNQTPNLTLNNGQLIPQLGLGVYKVNQNIALNLTMMAIDGGYRRVDTAALYDNEPEVGAAIRKSGLPREELFVTTKIWNDRQGYPEALEAIDESLSRLNIGYVDMLLIHWPAPKRGKFIETWRAFEEVLETGKVRGIGVSNFNQNHLEALLEKANVVPAINQVELNPSFQQPGLRAFHAAHGIQTEAWAPLARGRMMTDPTLEAIAATHGKSVAQVMLRWHIQVGNTVIPKTSNPDRLAENIDIFDFALSEPDMQAITGLDTGVRSGGDPNETN